MKIFRFESADQVAEEAALHIAQAARKAIFDHGRFTMAISGGRTPWQMLKRLTKEKLSWEKIFIFQVDERVAPDGHPDRNLTQLFQALEGSGLMTRINIFHMHVTAENLDEACDDYVKTIHEVTENGQFDLVHLGMGTDGHTASLIPDDAVCAISDRDVAITENPYQGRIRMTLTYPLIDRAKEILWVITGQEKQQMFERFLSGDETIPAGVVDKNKALVFTDLKN
jgi:6-phosphogluconolactonase